MPSLSPQDMLKREKLRRRMAFLKNRTANFRTFFFSEQLADTFLKIVDAEKFGDVAQRGVAEAVAGVFLGELHPNLLIRTLVQHHAIPQEQAREIGHKIASEIFAPVRDELVQIYRVQPPPWPEEEQRAQESPGETQKAAPVSAPPPPQPKMPERQPSTEIPKAQEMPARPQPQRPGPPPERYHIFPPPPPPPRSSWQGPPTAPPIPPAAPQMPPVPPSPPRPTERGNIVNLREVSGREEENPKP